MEHGVYNRKGSGTPDRANEQTNLVAGIKRDSPEGGLLVGWDGLPLWLQEGNHFIRTGHRPESRSFGKCFASWLYLHNESVNIHSHLLATLLFIIFPLFIYHSTIPPRYQVATVADIIVCSIYFAGIAICFLLSAIFHTTFNHSPSIFQKGMNYDFLGIILLMWSSTIPTIYYTFYCFPNLQIIYWVLLSTLALTCSILTINPTFSAPTQRPLRALTFSTFALFTLIPTLHSTFTYSRYGISLNWILITLIFNMAGATAYASKFPERWSTNSQFDIFGASHQILHVMVILAALAYTLGILAAFDFVHGIGGECIVNK